MSPVYERDVMISRMTAMMIQGGDIQVIDTSERSEAWLFKDKCPHALLLSCPLDKREEMEQVIAGIKNGDIELI
jgi:hypothetical protein